MIGLRTFSRRIPLLATSVFFLYFPGKAVVPSQSLRGAESSLSDNRVIMVICTDRERYSPVDSLRLSALLENTSGQRIYVDRRMFWTGYSGGLKLVIEDDRGNPLPANFLSDAPIPPPKEGDNWILIPLEQESLYGAFVNLSVKGLFPKPGRYSLRVIYKSWLRRQFVAQQYRDLPAIWAEAPAIVSQRVYIEIDP